MDNNNKEFFNLIELPDEVRVLEASTPYYNLLMEIECSSYVNQVLEKSPKVIPVFPNEFLTNGLKGAESASRCSIEGLSAVSSSLDPLESSASTSVESNSGKAKSKASQRHNSLSDISECRKLLNEINCLHLKKQIQELLQENPIPKEIIFNKICELQTKNTKLEMDLMDEKEENRMLKRLLLNKWANMGIY